MTKKKKRGRPGGAAMKAGGAAMKSGGAAMKAGGAAMKADKAAAEAAAPYRRTWPVRALSRASELGDQPQLLGLSAGVLALGLARGDGRMARTGARMIAAHLLATAAKNFVKHRIDRTRPRSANGTDGHRMKPGRSEAKEETSFPSGHSAGAMAVARAFARDYPEHRAAALGAAGLIALARIPRRAHYPTDVGAGLAIGLAAEAAVAALWPRVRTRYSSACCEELNRHCEERSDEAIQPDSETAGLLPPAFAGVAMTGMDRSNRSMT